MDHSEQQHAPKNEPSLQAGDAFSTEAPASVAHGEEMPAWLNTAAAVPTAAQRWGRRFAFLGIALLTIGLAGGATMLGLELYDSQHSMEVVSASSKGEIAAQSGINTAAPASAPAPAQAEALPSVEKRSPNLPPLVMLPTDPHAVPKKDGAAAGLPAAAPAAAVATAELKTPPATPPAVAEVKAPEVAKVVAAPAVATAPAPLMTKKLDKAEVAAPAEKPVKLATQPVKTAAPPVRATAAKAVARPKLATAAKKPATAVRRAGAPLAPRAEPRHRPVKGTMLQPPRDRGLDPAFQDPPRQAIDRRCHAGELARECEARIR